jgi:hypothetical protein
LDAAQLTNWLRYLDYIESQPDALAATVIIYERCLVACASYPGKQLPALVSWAGEQQHSLCNS